MFYIVTIYDIAKCSRCGEIYYDDMIDKYERYTWYTQSTVEKEERRLREKHIVSVIEAYTILEGEE